MGREGSFDVAVVGGGPAGLTAAYHAARAGARTVLLDRQAEPGGKIVLSGGGRCNILPVSVDPTRFVTDSSVHTLRKILLSWRLDEVRTFVEGPLGLRLREETSTGKLFPVSGGGWEVRRRFLQSVRRAGATLRTGTLVTGVDPGAPHRLRLEGGSALRVNRVVLATGGLSYPWTGSDGLGLRIARSLGQPVVEPYPALVPLRGDADVHRALSGLSVRVHLTVVDEGGNRVRSDGPLLFTHRGYSGPAVLNIGHLAARAHRESRQLRILVSWGDRPPDAWQQALSPTKRGVRGVLREVLPDRLGVALLTELELTRATCATLSRAKRHRLLEALTAYPLPWCGTGGFDEAEVTGGGVHLSQVDPRSLASRVVPAVHFCGEILDAFGPIGGTNFLWAFVTGKLAGDAAARGGS